MVPFTLLRLKNFAFQPSSNKLFVCAAVTPSPKIWLNWKSSSGSSAKSWISSRATILPHAPKLPFFHGKRITLGQDSGFGKNLRGGLK
jgi:hypothetical protein